MSINIINFIRFESGFIQCYLHGYGGALSGLNWRCNVIGISAGSISYNFSQNIGPSPLGMGKLFQDKNASSFTDNETITFSIKGAGGLVAAHCFLLI